MAASYHCIPFPDGKDVISIALIIHVLLSVAFISSCTIRLQSVMPYTGINLATGHFVTYDAALAVRCRLFSQGIWLEGQEKKENVKLSLCLIN
jgi:hypothetical protein